MLFFPAFPFASVNGIFRLLSSFFLLLYINLLHPQDNMTPQTLQYCDISVYLNVDLTFIQN